MDHKTIQKKLLRYLDDELSELEKVKVQRHLESCLECRDILKTIKSIWVTEQPIERQTVPPFLWTRISMRLNSERKQGILNKRKQFALPALRPVITAVVLLFIFFSGIKLGNLITGTTDDVIEISTETITDNFGMNYFEILPPGSLDASSLTLTENEARK